MKTILVATDYSDNAHGALQYAAALAAQIKAKIVLFNAYQMPVHAANTLLTPAAVDGLIDVNRQRLEKIARQTSEAFDIEVSSLSKIAYLEEVLNEVVEEANASLVVVGMHENNWSDFVFGNTALSAIRTSKKPVLVVPENAPVQNINRILFAMDETCIHSQNSFQELREIAGKLNAETEVFHVALAQVQGSTEPIFSLSNNQVETALQPIEHSYKEKVAANVVTGIVQEIKDYQADLLAVVAGKPGFWKRMLYQSTTRELALVSRIPLLVLPNGIDDSEN
jgi:nucleotide-binding universal stress UspA family protein